VPDAIANRRFEAGAATFEHEALRGRLARVAGGGLQRSVSEWALRQGCAVAGRYGRSKAQGILVAALRVLAGHFGTMRPGGRRKEHPETTLPFGPGDTTVVAPGCTSRTAAW
jgi:hypothetical protein